MARRGRKPTGANLVERLEGSERAKTRLKAILETLSGQRTIPDACEELGIQESMFHRVRSEVLQTALDRLEPRPLGRPPRQPSPAGRSAWPNWKKRTFSLQVEFEGGRGPPGTGGEAAAAGQAGRHGPGKKTTTSTTQRRRRKRSQETPTISRTPKSHEPQRLPTPETRLARPTPAA